MTNLHGSSVGKWISESTFGVSMSIESRLSPRQLHLISDPRFNMARKWVLLDRSKSPVVSLWSNSTSKGPGTPVSAR
jgi:hypothetical protein